MTNPWLTAAVSLAIPGLPIAQTKLANILIVVADDLGVDNVGVSYERTDRNVPVDLLNPIEASHTVDVDQVAGSRQPKLHHRDQALSSGENTAVIAVLSEKTERFVDGGRGVVGERRGIHGTSRLRSFSDATPSTLTSVEDLSICFASFADYQVAEFRPDLQRPVAELTSGDTDCRQVDLRIYP